MTPANATAERKQRLAAFPKPAAIGTSVDPVMLEVFNNLCMSIAEQMGATLANTAASVNIKERLDFSCALFDTKGEMIAQGRHGLPAFLGCMAQALHDFAVRHRRQPGHARVVSAEMPTAIVAMALRRPCRFSAARIFDGNGSPCSR